MQLMNELLNMPFKLWVKFYHDIIENSNSSSSRWSCWGTGWQVAILCTEEQASYSINRFNQVVVTAQTKLFH